MVEEAIECHDVDPDEVLTTGHQDQYFSLYRNLEPAK